jgi:hypothetical protein
MKKLTTLLLVITTSLILTACGGGGGSESSDGRDTSSDTLPADAAKLTWVAPSTRADSSYLPPADLEGYRVYYGTSAASLILLVDLNDNSITEFDLDTLPSGNYYFAVTAYDSEGNESGYSNVINKDV